VAATRKLPARLSVALAIAIRKPPDLVISDIRMPELDGIETVKRIRQLLQDAGKSPVPEILITGYTDENSYKRALELNPRMDVARRNVETAYVHSGHLEDRVAELRTRLEAVMR